MSIQENTSELQSILEQVNNLPNANVEHNHDDLYYTKAESDERFDSKADAEHNHDSLYYTKTQSDELLAAKADEGHSHSEYRVKTYASLLQIGLTNGSETIDSIVTNLPNNSILVYATGANHATSIYPVAYGLCEVAKNGDSTRVVFKFYQKSTTRAWFGVYDSSASTKWTGWTEIGNAEDYLPLDGSKSVTGNLKIERSGWMSVMLKNTTSGREGRLASSNNGDSVQISNWVDDNNLSYLNLNKETSTLSTMLQLSVKKNGNTTSYDIFGEHNIDLLSSNLITTGAELTSGVSALSSGKIHLVLE